MATVTGLTAARMLAIEAQSIVDGDIVGDDLILTRFDNGTINAGSVKGPPGDPGDPGEVSAEDLDDAINPILFDVAALDGRVTTAESDIDVVESDIGTLEAVTNFGAITTGVTAIATTTITSFSARVSSKFLVFEMLITNNSNKGSFFADNVLLATLPVTCRGSITIIQPVLFRTNQSGVSGNIQVFYNPTNGELRTGHNYGGSSATTWTNGNTVTLNSGLILLNP